MDIYAYLKRDHMKVAELMQQLLDIRLAAFHRRLFEQIKAELVLHTEAEERTFYKAIAETGSAAVISHARHDHEEIRQLLDELTDMSENNEMWMVKFGELKHAVTHHIQEEETEVWKQARMVLMPDQEQRLARDMEREKQTLRSEFMVAAQ